MKAICWYGKHDVRVEDVPMPHVLNPRDAIVKITSTAICGSDLHFYDGFIPAMEKGDIVGHEFMGEVVEVGLEVRNLEVGDRIELRNSVWTIVGVFKSGNSHESGFLADVDTLISAYQRTQVSSATVLLTSPGAFDELEAAITADPTLDVQVLREPEYYRGQSEEVQAILSIVTTVVAGIMALGALLAALNSMYTAVSTRAVEIATLRAIGFGSAGVVVSVLVETMLLAVVGALIGAAAAWLLFGGNTVSMGNQVSTLVFQVRMTPSLLGIGIVLACAVGFVGGLPPAIRASRLPAATALRAV